MSWIKGVRNFAILASAAICVASSAAQGVTDEMLKHPPRDSWPGFHGDYTGQRHSSLTEINPSNVTNMTLAWTFQTQQNGGVKSTYPIVDLHSVFPRRQTISGAADARTGHQIQHYTAPPNKAFHIGQRGVSMYKDKILLYVL